MLVHAHGQVIGPVNRRASAILAPLLQGRLIDVEVQQNQEAGGQTGKALYIFAKLGKAGNQQVIQLLVETLFVMRVILDVPHKSNYSKCHS